MKKLKVIVSIDKQEMMAEEEKKKRVAQFFVLLAKWKAAEISKSYSRDLDEQQ